MINPQWLELPISRTNFHGPKDVRAIEVGLYLVSTVGTTHYEIAELWKAEYNDLSLFFEKAGGNKIKKKKKKKKKHQQTNKKQQQQQQNTK